MNANQQTNNLPPLVSITEDGDQDEWLQAMRTNEHDVKKSGDNAPLIHLGEPRYVVMDRIARLKLPHANYVSLDLESFLLQPGRFIDAIACRQFHFYVEPILPGLGRFKYKNISAERLLTTCHELRDCLLGYCRQYQATLLAAPPLAFHGSVVIELEGKHVGRLIAAEFVSGESQPVSRSVTPQFRVTQDAWLGTYKYNFDDEETRKTLYRSLQILPSGEDIGLFGRGGYFIPGYYEIGITDCALSNQNPQYYFHKCHLFLHDIKQHKPWSGTIHDQFQV